MSVASPTSRHCYRIECSMMLQSNRNPSQPTTSNFKSAAITVGRNQNRSIVLSLELRKGKNSEDGPSYLLRDIKVHHQFAVQKGRGCIEIPEKKLQIYLSNCPPQQLNVFLKTIEAKLKLLNSLGTPTRLNRELGFDVPRIFSELSPLTLYEIKKIRPGLRDATNQMSRQNNNKNATPVRTTPNKKSLKRTIISPADTPVRKKRVGTKASGNIFDRLKPSTAEDKVALSADQRTVLSAVQSGKNVFFTGSAGTGKSLVLKKLLGFLPPESTFVTAATGVAACQIGGTTLHSFAGIGSGEASLPVCLELASRATVTTQWRKCSHLVVDEISMIDADYFTKLDMVAQYILGKREPFGGIQLILCGDFHQLPPISKPGESRKFCFQSRSWNEAIKCSVLLTKIHRQSDSKFIQVLQEIRRGRCSNETFRLLEETRSHKVNVGGILATKLCTHKADVDAINTNQLEKLEGKQEEYLAIDSQALPKAMSENLCPKELRLKVGAQVMLTRNMDLSRGLSNGSRGVVQSLRGGYPTVKFSTGHVETIKPHRFFLKLAGSNDGNFATRIQLPLRLAWAISIHKSQGMSLDRVEMSLGKVFENGQAYVALSRARSLEGLRVLEFSPNCVRTHPHVLTFYAQLGKADHSSYDPKQEAKPIK